MCVCVAGGATEAVCCQRSQQERHPHCLEAEERRLLQGPQGTGTDDQQMYMYDKRDSFQFDIVNFPDMSSNIPSKPTYGIYISQLVRIGRICSSYNQFCDRHYKLTEKLIAQGFRYVELCKAFKKFARSHADIFNKYSYSIRRHIQDGICLPACDAFLGCHVSTHRGSKGLYRR